MLPKVSFLKYFLSFLLFTWLISLCISESVGNELNSTRKIPSAPAIKTTKKPVRADPLKSSDVSEGACLVDGPTTVFPNPFFWLTSRTYYLPIASEYAFRRYAEVFLGRSASSKTELESMCLRLETSGLSFKTFGYGEYIKQTCAIPLWDLFTALKWGVLKCSVDEKSSEILQDSFIVDYADYLVLTDSETFGMYVRCVNGFRDFKVVTTTPDIHEDLVRKVREKAVSLGFDGNLVSTLRCKDKASQSTTKSPTPREEL